MYNSLARDKIKMMQNMEVIQWYMIYDDIDSIISRVFN